MPLTSKTFSQLIDFTRTSAATYVDQLGRIVPTPVSLNELTFSQEFDNAAWAKVAGGTGVVPVVTPNAALAPDGTQTADLIVFNRGNGTSGADISYISNNPISFTGNGTASIWLKTADGTTRSLQLRCGAPVASAITVTSVWQRFSVSSFSATIDRLQLLLYGTDPNQTASLHVWGAQLEQTPDANLTLGSELTTNGTLDTDTAWAKGTGWTISSGAAQGNVGAFQVIDQTITITAGKVYRVSFDVTAYSSGNVRASLIGGTAVIGAVRASTGQYVAYLAAVSGNNKIAIGSDGSGFIGTVDNISVREVTAASPSTYTRNFGGRFPPRFDYDPVTLAPRGLLIEEQRTNLFTRSEEFDNASWIKTNATVTANAATSPDGTVDADSLVENTSAGSHDTYGSATLTAAAHTFSVYVKPNGRTWLNMFVFQSGGADTSTWFNLSAGTLGTVGTGATASIAPVGNGWYRCSITFTALAAAASAYVRMTTGNGLSTYTGNGTSGIFVWGAQLEAGAFATSYIPTVASQVTRTADSAAITGANFSSWFNPAEGTLLVEATTSGDILSSYSASIVDASVTNIIGTDVDSSGAYRLRVTAANVNQALVAVVNPIAANTTYKLAGAYRVNDFAASANGGAVGTDTSGTVPTGLSYLAIGSNSSTGAVSWNGHIRSIRYYPTRLTNAQLQALTA